MAGSRTLKLSILADVDDLRKKLNQGENDVQGFGGKLDNFSKMAGVAFAAAGAAAVAYAGKLAVDGVKAAIEDEAAQVRLASALKNVTGATAEQIKSAEDWVLKTSLQTGIADDKLRPALERITRSTKDIAEAQKLTTLAVDIAKAKNLDLTTVANALAKANDGNTNSLKKLGITLGDNAQNLAEYNKLQKALEKAQIDANFALEQYGQSSKEYIRASQKVAEITEKSNNVAKAGIDVFGELGKEFSGAAAEAANTFQGKMERLKVAFDEAKETVGGFILDAITPIITLIVDKVVPALGAFSGGISNNLQPTIKFFKPILESLTGAFNEIKDAFVRNQEKLEPLFNLFKAIGNFVRDFLAPIIGKSLGEAFKIVGNIIGGLIDQFANVVDFFDKIYQKIKAIIDFLKNNPVTKFFTSSYETGGMTPTPVPTTPTNNYTTGLYSGGGTVINVSGAIDPESVARQINDILTQSAARGGGATNLIYA